MAVALARRPDRRAEEVANHPRGGPLRHVAVLAAAEAGTGHGIRRGQPLRVRGLPKRCLVFVARRAELRILEKGSVGSPHEAGVHVVERTPHEPIGAFVAEREAVFGTAQRVDAVGIAEFVDLVATKARNAVGHPGPAIGVEQRVARIEDVGHHLVAGCTRAGGSGVVGGREDITVAAARRAVTRKEVAHPEVDARPRVHAALPLRGNLRMALDAAF